MILTDSHAHVDGAEFDADRADVLARARAAGVERIVVIGAVGDPSSAERAVALAELDPAIWATVATHPHDVGKMTPDWWAVHERFATHPRVVAIGETGLDYYWPGKLDGCADIEDQVEGFRWHIDLAKRMRKPLMIHNREADHDLLTVLLDEGAPETVIFHCFSSDTNMAMSCVAEGYILSFSGTVSFKNAHELREAAKVVPGDQILVETDAPYLTPHPYRGAPNEPYCLPYTVRALAELREQDPLELAKTSTANARRVYGI